MGTNIKARYSEGALKPLEPVELREGEEVTVTIVRLPSTTPPDWLERTAGGWVGLVDAEKLKRAIYESRAALAEYAKAATWRVEHPDEIL